MRLFTVVIFLILLPCSVLAMCFREELRNMERITGEISPLMRILIICLCTCSLTCLATTLTIICLMLRVEQFLPSLFN